MGATFALFTAALASAQAPATTSTTATSSTTTLLDEVVVAATRTEEPASRVSSAFTRLDSDEINRAQIQSVKEATLLSPGVYLRSVGAALGAGADGGISIRGLPQEYTLVRVDGVHTSNPLMLGGGVGPMLSTASVYNLESVEVVRGPQSVLYGADAVGGVVALQTKRGSGDPSTLVFFEGGSFSTFREGIQSDGSIDKLDYSFHYAREDSKNDRPFNRAGINTFSLRLDYTVNDDLTIGFSNRTAISKYKEPGSTGLWGAGTADVKTAVLALWADFKATEIWTSKLQFSVNVDQYDWKDRDPGDGGFISFTNAHSSTYMIDWQNILQLAETNKLVLGASLYWERTHDQGVTEDWNFYPLPEKCEFNDKPDAFNFAFYAEDQWNIIDNLFLTAGMRYDHYDIYGSAFTWRIGAAYLVEPTRTKLRVNYGTAFRAPSFPQSFGTKHAFGKDLDPEHSQSWDIGFDQFFLEDRLSVGASYFQNHVKDKIEWVGGSGPWGACRPWLYVNRDKFRSEGLEASVVMKLTDCWNLRMAYTYMESESKEKGQNWMRAMRVPRNIFNCETNYTFDLPKGKLTLGGGVLAISNRKDPHPVTFAPVLNPGYTVLRVHAKYDYNENVAFTFRVENLGNKRYDPILGYPAPGRGFFGGVQVKF